MKWFWGKTKNTGHFRFHTSTLLQKPDAQPRMEQKHYAVREIAGMYGLQVRGVFLGLIKIGKYTQEQSEWKPAMTERVDEAEVMRRILDQQALVRFLKPPKQKDKLMEELIEDANNHGLEASNDKE